MVRSFSCVVDSDVFADVLPPVGSGKRDAAYAAALRRGVATCLKGACARRPPSHAALAAAESFLVHKAHGALLRACAAATDEASAELRLGATMHTPPDALACLRLDLSPALEHLATLQSRTLPLVRGGAAGDAALVSRR